MPGTKCYYANEFLVSDAVSIGWLYLTSSLSFVLNGVPFSRSPLCALPPTHIDNHHVAKLLCFWWTVTQPSVLVVATRGTNCCQLCSLETCRKYSTVKYCGKHGVVCLTVTRKEATWKEGTNISHRLTASVASSLGLIVNIISNITWHYHRVADNVPATLDLGFKNVKWSAIGSS